MKYLLALLTFMLFAYVSPVYADSQCVSYNEFQKAVIVYKPEFYKLKDAKKFIDWINEQRARNGVPALEADEFHIGIMKGKVGSVFLYKGCVLLYTSTATLDNDFWEFMKRGGLTLDDFIKEVYSEGSA